MAATRTLTITVLDDVAEAVDLKIASGDFASESELFTESLRYFTRADEDVEIESEEFNTWLRAEVMPVLDELDKDPSKVLSAEQVKANMMRTRENFRKAG
jgi:antitoxin ParD1/3/4